MEGLDKAAYIWDNSSMLGTSRRYKASMGAGKERMARPTYMDRKRAGEAVDILDEIGAWHESDFAGPLHEWLGMSWEEYARWVMPDAPLDPGYGQA